MAKRKKSEIKGILLHHGISLDECKIFGEAINKFYPVSADLHFLIAPNHNCGLTEEKWEMLKQAIEDLFPACYILFYTPDILDSLVKFKQLAPEHADLAKKDAEPLTKIFEKVHGTPGLMSPISQPISAPFSKMTLSPVHAEDQQIRSSTAPAPQ